MSLQAAEFSKESNPVLLADIDTTETGTVTGSACIILDVFVQFLSGDA
jgi:hypothetical protein